MAQQSRQEAILIEGGHIARGELACLCAAIAFPGVGLHVLRLSDGNRPEPLVPRSTVHSVALATYYETFEDLLASNYMLVVPCTQRGIVLANRLRQATPVLAESWLVDMAMFDKRYLRQRFSALSAHFTKIVDDWRDGRTLLAKPWSQHSSIGQLLVTRECDFYRLQASGEYFFEEWFENPLGHYSCSIFRGGQWACIERLAQSEGRTALARLPRDRRALAFCETLRAGLKLDSVVNFQFADVDGFFRIYDINPRFGYSELFRTCWGTNFVSSYFGLSNGRLTDKDELTGDAAWSLLRSIANAVASRASK